MKVQRIIAHTIFLSMFLTPCFAHHMAVVVNHENNVGNVTAVYLSKIFRSEVKKWPDGTAIALILLRNSAAENGTIERLIKVSDQEWKALIAAHKDAIQTVDSDAEVLKLVQSTPGAIGLVDVRSVDNSINVVHVDRKLPMEAGYLPH
jgi:ABC-type phosphate transport system substrate-binding protein